MPTFVNPGACNSCAGEHQGPLCVYICPNDAIGRIGPTKTSRRRSHLDRQIPRWSGVAIYLPI